MRDAFTGDERNACDCEATFEGDRLVVDADDCPGRGVLADAPGCRATVVDALTARDADAVVTRRHGVERAYEDASAALLVAAGRFAEQVAFRDEHLAARALRDPLGAGHDAAGRAGAASDVAAETGLAEVARTASGYDAALRPYVGPTLARSRVAARPPPGATLDGERTLDTGATVRSYARPDRELRTYHLDPAERTLDADALRTLRDAHELLATGGVTGAERAPGRAVRCVADDDDAPVATLTDVLEKHTRGHGVLDDLFADPRLSDAFATAPAERNPIRVTVDGESMRTNVRLTADATASLASRLRRSSGRAFSRASPTLDATVDAGPDGERVRVAAVTDPASDGIAFAFRAHDAEAWTLPALVANGTLPVDAAALLSVAVERDAAGLVAGTRGAGKTTLLGALLWELPAATRTVVIEDTPELPVAALQRAGRDVQSLRTTTDANGRELSPTAALRTALRLGEGALVLGEVRGEEAQVLYEAMRVGASGSAVLGTVHGDGAAAVRERVVADLGVPLGSFAATDLVVTLEPHETDDGRARRVAAVEEVVRSGDDVRFESLFSLDGETLQATGRLARGNSVLAASLARADESYADLRGAVNRREGLLADMVSNGRTAPDAVVERHAERRSGTGSC